MKPRFQLLAGIACALLICAASSKALDHGMKNLIDAKAPAAEAESPAGDVLIPDDFTEINIADMVSAEEAGIDLDDYEIVFEDGAEEMFFEELATVTYGSKIYYNWHVAHHESAFSKEIYLKAGQHLFINASYKPTDKLAYIGYVSPDKQVHLIGNGSQTVSKSVQLLKSGSYRICYMNRSTRSLYVSGYYKLSK